MVAHSHLCLGMHQAHIHGQHQTCITYGTRKEAKYVNMGAEDVCA
jgi:hypothetical protein